MDPATAMAGAQVVGGGLSMLSSMQQGQTASAAAGFNKMIAEQNAQLARDRAKADAEDIAVGTRKSQGSIRANSGASGLVVEDGSPLEALLDNAATGELNRQRRLWAGEMEARNFMVDAYGEELKGYSARQKSTGGMLGGAASLLTGANKIAGMLKGGGGQFTDPTIPTNAGYIAGGAF